ncbi:MFS transporter [Sinorhizobium meliloti]|uniref:MFS transporter n=1 Tax=Rhizobium meliloti TaxID=382 RepID=UPI000FDBBADD|nr:MFS transporter [Sinorhizobium meliloti]RVE82140.1 hypothetical protein CN238_28705 [Sinorhizobium meliloti]RVH24049.1 hypothetical protein CN214_26420 [Sinorhizobium meliloti]
MTRQFLLSDVAKYYVSLARNVRGNSADLYCLFFLSIGYVGIISFIYRLIFVDANISQISGALITVAFTCSVRFSRIPLLSILAGISSKLLYVAGSILSILAHMCLYLDQSPIVLLLGLSLIGACYGQASTLVMVSAAKGGADSPFVGISVRSNIAILVGAPIGVWLYNDFGPQYGFLSGAAVSTVALVFATKVIDHSAVPQSPPRLQLLIAVLVRNRQALAALILLIFSWATCHQVYIIIPRLSTDNHFPVSMTSFFFAAKSIAVVVVSAPIYVIARMLDASLGQLFSCGIALMISAVIISTGSFESSILISAILFASGEIILVPLIAIALSKVVAPSEQTAIFVLHPVALGIAEILGGTIGSLIAAIPSVGTYTLATLVVVANLIQFRIMNRLRVFDGKLRDIG